MPLDLHGLMLDLKPIFDSFMDALITAFIGWLMWAVQKFLGIKSTESDWAVFHSAAKSAAGRLWAASDASISTMKIGNDNQTVIWFANKAISYVPELERRIGFDPYKVGQDGFTAFEKAMQNEIAAELGKLQASSTPAPKLLPFSPIPAGAESLIAGSKQAA
jgi:hypothetical protein